MDSIPSTEWDLGTVSNPAEMNKPQQQNSLSEHSSRQQIENDLDHHSSVIDSLTTLSISAEPFQSTSFEQSAATQLSVFAKEFVPKTIPGKSYTESYQTYVVYKKVFSKLVEIG